MHTDKRRWINVLFRVASFNGKATQKVVNSLSIISDLCHGDSESKEDATLLGAISSVTGINHRCTRINRDNEALFLFLCSSYFAMQTRLTAKAPDPSSGLEQKAGTNFQKKLL